ncbi:AAA family ATPase [Pseudomonas chengduensis]|jgi:predicted ATPase|nr:AAA family ATPase [Pseudomonas chengduensis]MBG0846217.1 AAA family ATPase [Pseudomonas chengduensis]
MKYRESQLDKDLRKWFQNDNSCANLKSISISKGSIRALSELLIQISYPITAIAGKNGSGKSTILALACCAFHNESKFSIPGKTRNYYTYADFFIQHKEEIPPQGIEIFYGIFHNNWTPTKVVPEGVGLAYQKRSKTKGGKWNDYALRVNRNVVFIGIGRIVPHSEKSQSKSYNRYFKDSELKGWEDKVKDSVGYILRKSYDSFKIARHTKYRLPIAKTNEITYSGFNMGAGENALFEIFTTVHSCPPGTLFVIDEIELGLHVEAQKRFISKLKELCLEKKAQIVCTTHSKEIFECLPEEARLFIERINNKTLVTQGISPEFAFHKLSAENHQELDIFVEDDVANSLITHAIPAEIRARCNIETIGSATALCVQLAALYNRKTKKKTLILFDADQKALENNNRNHTKNTSQKPDEKFEEWFNKHIVYLPGNTWPEAWILQKSKESIHALAENLNISPDNLSDILEAGEKAGKHNEFYEIGKLVGLNRDLCLNNFSLHITRSHKADFEPIIKKITEILKV